MIKIMFTLNYIFHCKQLEKTEGIYDRLRARNGIWIFFVTFYVFTEVINISLHVFISEFG